MSVCCAIPLFFLPEVIIELLLVFSKGTEGGYLHRLTLSNQCCHVQTVQVHPHPPPNWLPLSVPLLKANGNSFLTSSRNNKGMAQHRAIRIDAPELFLHGECMKLLNQECQEWWKVLFSPVPQDEWDRSVTGDLLWSVWWPDAEVEMKSLYRTCQHQTVIRRVNGGNHSVLFHRCIHLNPWPNDIDVVIIDGGASCQGEAPHLPISGAPYNCVICIMVKSITTSGKQWPLTPITAPMISHFLFWNLLFF